MDEENKSQKKQLEEAAGRESELQKEIKSLLRKVDDVESKVSSAVRESELQKEIKSLLRQLDDVRSKIRSVWRESEL